MDENGRFFEPTGFVPRTQHKLHINGEQILFILRVQNYWVFDFALNCITSGPPTYSPLYNYVAILHGGNKLFLCRSVHLWRATFSLFNIFGNQHVFSMQATNIVIDTAAMWVVERLVGVAAEVNLRISLVIKHVNEGIHSGFEIQGRWHKKSKRGGGLQWPHKNLYHPEKIKWW